MPKGEASLFILALGSLRAAPGAASLSRIYASSDAGRERQAGRAACPRLACLLATRVAEARVLSYQKQACGAAPALACAGECAEQGVSAGVDLCPLPGGTQRGRELDLAVRVGEMTPCCCCSEWPPKKAHQPGTQAGER